MYVCIYTLGGRCRYPRIDGEAAKAWAASAGPKSCAQNRSPSGARGPECVNVWESESKDDRNIHTKKRPCTPRPDCIQTHSRSTPPIRGSSAHSSRLVGVIVNAASGLCQRGREAHQKQKSKQTHTHTQKKKREIESSPGPM